VKTFFLNRQLSWRRDTMRSILTSRSSSAKSYRALPLAALLLGLAFSPATAQQVPADSVLRDFKPSGDFIFVLDGKSLRHAEMFRSERAVAYLVIAPELTFPLMVGLRTQSVESVDLMKVVRKADGTIDILADATLARVGSIRLDGKKLVWSMGSQSAKLIERPWLLGRQAGRALTENVEYRHKASVYTPQAAPLETLRALGHEVVVKTYFGSWCPHCKQVVPRILRVAEELEGSKIRFEYYGLPKPMGSDPETEKAGIQGVPTVVVYVDGKETARLAGHDLTSPEVGLGTTLGGS
jgi:thiol-disulfide isomerase/thioredoxin